MNALFELLVHLPVIEEVGGLSCQKIYDSLFNSSRQTGESALEDLGEVDYSIWRDSTWRVIESREDVRFTQPNATYQRENNRKILESRSEELGRLLIKDVDFCFLHSGTVGLGPWPASEPNPSSTDHVRTLPLPGVVEP